MSSPRGWLPVKSSTAARTENRAALAADPQEFRAAANSPSEPNSSPTELRHSKAPSEYQISVSPGSIAVLPFVNEAEESTPKIGPPSESDSASPWPRIKKAGGCPALQYVISPVAVSSRARSKVLRGISRFVRRRS